MPEDHIPVPSPPNHSTGRRRNLLEGSGQKVVALALLLGAVGGAASSYAMVQFFPGAIPVSKRQVVVQESSAVIDVAEKVSPAVVSITSKTVTRGFFGNVQQAEGAGTGMIVTADGLIMTNRHVVDDANANYTVITSDGKSYPAKIVSRDTSNDVAFIRISASKLPTVELADSGSVKVGQRVVAIGNALGQFQNSVTEGIISGLGRGVEAGGGSANGGASESLQNLLQTDAAINPGNSGGPLVNLDGQVVGINTAVAGEAQNIGFAIPINEAKPLITSVKEKGRIVRAYLGVRYVPVDKKVAAANSLAVDYGAWIQAADDQNLGVIVDSPAAKAGVKEGDIIIKIGGDKIDSTHSLQSLIGKHKPGEKVQITVSRDGKEQSFEATLEEAPVVAGQ